MESARQSRSLVRFSTRFESSRVTGYIMDFNQSLVLLSVIDDGIWFNGFACYRLTDIKGLEAPPYAAFVEKALQLRGEQIPPGPDVSLSGIGEFLRTASLCFPLLTVHCQKIDGSICWVGKVIAIKSKSVSILEIDPAAKWNREPTPFKLSNITRIDFGGDYENALHLVGGDPVDAEEGRAD